jgi:hypothetical protein
MKAIVTEATYSTPAVNFSEDGRMLIEGRSHPEDVNNNYTKPQSVSQLFSVYFDEKKKENQKVYRIKIPVKAP